MKEDFHKHLNNKEVKNELFENDIYGLYLSEDENLDTNLSAEDLSKRIKYYMELVNNFIENNNNI
jgi:beta-lactamase class A